MRCLNADIILEEEQSGHIICLDYSCTGDGAITSVQMAYIMMKIIKL